MKYNRPSLKELNERSYSDFLQEYDGERPQLRYSFARAFASVVAGASHLLHGHLDWIAKQATPKTATGDYLVKWGETVKVNYKSATNAVIEVELTGLAFKKVSSDIRLKHKERPELEFELENDSKINDSGRVLAIAQGLYFGGSHLLREGDQIGFISPLEGINNVAVIKKIIRDAQSREDEEDYRQRVLSAFSSQGRIGTKEDYKFWVSNVPDVKVLRSQVFEHYFLSNGVGIAVLVNGDNERILPSESEIQNIQRYIDDYRPLTSYVRVFAPISVPVTIKIKTNEALSSESFDLATSELKDYFKNSLGFDEKVKVNVLRDIITSSINYSDYQIIYPANDVEIPKGHIGTFDKLEWSLENV